MADNSTPVLEVHDLVKSYGHVEVLKGVTMSVGKERPRR